MEEKNKYYKDEMLAVLIDSKGQGGWYTQYTGCIGEHMPELLFHKDLVNAVLTGDYSMIDAEWFSENIELEIFTCELEEMARSFHALDLEVKWVLKGDVFNVVMSGYAQREYILRIDYLKFRA